MTDGGLVSDAHALRRSALTLVSVYNHPTSSRVLTFGKDAKWTSINAC